MVKILLLMIEDGIKRPTQKEFQPDLIIRRSAA